MGLLYSARVQTEDKEMGGAKALDMRAAGRNCAANSLVVARGSAPGRYPRRYPQESWPAIDSAVGRGPLSCGALVPEGGHS